MNRQLNILHLQTYDTGGAYMAAARLHQHLRTSGMNSKLMVRTQLNRGSDVVACHPQNTLRLIGNKVKFLFAQSGSGVDADPDYVFRDSVHAGIREIRTVIDRLPFRPDVIVAHWISDFLDAAQLREISRYCAAPVIWHLLDMAPLTGGCHYAWDCAGYTCQCGSCPALHSDVPDDRSHLVWKEKQQQTADMDMAIVAATGWLAEQAGRSSLFREKRVEKILLGVDPGIFMPVSRDIPRKRFRLPLDRKIIFFGAQSLKSRRKGLAYLNEALKILLRKRDVSGRNVMLITSGYERDIGSSLDSGIPYAHLGFLDDEVSLAAAYQSADLFVCPSIEDSGPMMINEAIMCGTPVVSFDMGVARDLVHTGKTGYRAELKNAEDLAQGMQYILEMNSEEAADMSEHCRQTALDLCHPEVQAGAFRTLFALLGGGVKTP